MVLLAAEAWGMPPWELAAMRGDKRAWYWRFLAWRNAVEERAKNE